MPLENQSFNESPIQDNSQKKSTPLVLILVILILLAGSYLAYSLYSTNQTDETNTSDLANQISQESDMSQVEEPDEVTSPTDENTKSGQRYTLAQVAENNNKDSCWTIIDGNVYDITSYIPNHPGGESDIVKICGKDGSQLFAKPQEHKDGGANNVLSRFKIGSLQ
jgi:cytochrome b involved in lipid metabolism